MQARTLYHSIGTPSIADLKAAIHMITVINNLVTTADVDLAKKIWTRHCNNQRQNIVMVCK